METLLLSKIPIFLSFLPLLIFTVLLLWSRISLLKTSLITVTVFTGLVLLYWKINPVLIYYSFGKGFFVALDIFIIIWGAIFFLDYLEKKGVIKNISYYLEHFSKDYRVQIISLAWIFESFLEGTAGFGTPVAIVAPLLLGLGLSPIKSLVVALIGNSTAGVFGAAGTPIKVGFAGLNITSVPLIASLINCIGFIIPVFMLWTITRQRTNFKKEFMDGLPFAMWSGIVFVVSSVIFVTFGQEFPSILGSAIAMMIIFVTTKLKIFTPKEHITLKNEVEIKRTMTAFHSFLPYGLLVMFLIVGKLFLGKISVPILLGFFHQFNLFNPGFVFIVSGIMVAIIWKSRVSEVVSILYRAFKESLGPFFVISLMSIFVQIMIYSGQNSSGIPSAITLIATVFETPYLPFFTPLVGAFGSFITGSVTVSNIMFGSFFETTSTVMEMNTAVILALAVVGAAVGNMIALADMLAAQAVLKLKNQEKQILKGVFVPCVFVLILVGIIGMILI